jgi:hypothetical protein
MGKTIGAHICQTKAIKHIYRSSRRELDAVHPRIGVGWTI